MYEAKKYDHLIGIRGFSEALLKNHFTLYQGYVANTNKLAELLTIWMKEGRTGPEYSEIQRRFAWEWNGMRLHELYFENLGGKGGVLPDGALMAAITRDFGGFENFKKAFVTTGSMRGIGWVVLYQADNRLTISWINEHDVGHLAGATPILVMDVFEHAFMLDYGLRRADYIAAFFDNIDWEKVQARLH